MNLYNHEFNCNLCKITTLYVTVEEKSQRKRRALMTLGNARVSIDVSELAALKDDSTFAFLCVYSKMVIIISHSNN